MRAVLPRLRAGLALAAVLLAACGSDPNQPPDPPGPPDPPPIVPGDPAPVRMAIGDTVVRTVTTAELVAVFSVQATAPGELAFFYQVEQGSFAFTVRDSASGEVLADDFVPANAEPGQLLLRRTPLLDVGPGQVLLVRVRNQSSGDARIRFMAYRVNRAPEGATVALTIGDTVSSELENSADIDEFTLSASAGDELIGYIQGQAGTVPGAVVLQILNGTDTVAGVENAGPGELELQATERFVIPADGTYRVLVGQFRATDTEADNPGTGEVRLAFRRIVRAPESVPAELAAGDTLETESIDHVGDIDEFRVPVTAGESYNVFLQTVAPAPQIIFRLSVVRQADGTELEVFSTSGDTALAGQFTGNHVATADGDLLVRVTGSPDGWRRTDRGAYRLFVYAVDRAPELVPAALTTTGSVVETIEYPGDIDQFTVSPTATGVTNVILERAEAGTRLDLSGPGFASVCYQAGRCSLGRVGSAEPYVVTIRSGGINETTPFRGSYGLSVVAIDTMPEGRGTAFGIGETVTEAIDPVGDYDWYSFEYELGQFFRINATGFDGSSASSLALGLRNAAGTPIGSSGGRFLLPTAGTYRVYVTGSIGGSVVTEVGPYSFTLSLVPTGVEGGVSTIGVGDSLTTEAIDVPGDVDEFVLNGTPGSEIQVYVRGTNVLRLEALEMGSHTLLGADAGHFTGRIVIPMSGQLRVRVYQLNFDSYSPFSGEYDLVTHQIDRAPESVGSVITRGTPVSAERIDPVGDVDEYTYAGTAGEMVALTLSSPFGFDFARVLAEIIDPSSGTVLGSVDANDGGVMSSGPVQLPGTRSYLVRVRGLVDTAGYGGYRLVLE